VDNLKTYRKYVTVLSIVWHSLVIIFSVALTFVLLVNLETRLALAIGLATLFCLTIIVSIALSKPYVSATEFLARVILHVSSESADMPAPNSSSLKAGREFMERLASYVYDMSSRSALSAYPMSQGQGATAPTHNDNQAQASINDSPLPFFVIDSNNMITNASNSAAAFLGTSMENIVGKSVYDTLRFSFSSEDTLENWLRFSSEKSVTAMRSWDRVKIQTPSEIIKQVDMSARFSKNDTSGNEVVLVLFDHSEKYGRDDGGASFVSMAVHELRTPLTIMRGYIEVFEEEITDKLDPEQKEFLRSLSVQAQQLGSFVSNIQNLARIEANALELQLKQDNWSQVLDSALNDMDMRAKVRHKEIVRKIDEDLPMVGVDRTTIYEVLVNIIENAIKYTHTDGKIIVSSYRKDDNWVETTIQDHGIGIPDGLLGHVFDKFYRSHRSSKSVGGTGLGLFISKTIVEAHGGEIWVKTKEGEGSTFGFTVPTYESIASEANSSDNNAIERSAHGWIKNHTLYRG
jgi:signal transduction histidine kinase